jgi:hypothetical protein
MLSEVDLRLYEKGVCYVKPWCSDSKRLALQLKSTPLRITYIDYNDDKVYEFIDDFVDTNMQANIKNIEVAKHFFVPQLYLFNRTTKVYDGPWTTHHSRSVTFKNRVEPKIKF